MSYGDYLQLDRLLGAQQPRSDDHNEMLFIVQHQATELWMKLVIHELRAARDQIRRDDLQPAFKMLARVARIMAQLIQSWDVLSTLTPRRVLSPSASRSGTSSGFQSYQYRMIEFLLGNKSAVLMEPHRHRAAFSAPLEAALRAPTLYDEAIRLLARRGFAIDPRVLERDWTQPYTRRRVGARRVGRGLSRHRRATGSSTSSPRSWSTSRTRSASGASATSPRWSASSASSAAPAAPRASATCAAARHPPLPGAVGLRDRAMM